MLELSKRSHLARGGRIIAGLVLVTLGTGAVFADIEPQWASWLFLSIATFGLIAISFWKSEDKEELNEEDLIEIAKTAIKAEADRLDTKRADLEKVLMAYGEWMEYPDFDELREGNWATQERTEQDSHVARLLDVESDLLIDRFSKGIYWEDKKFQTRVLLLDLFNFVEAIAKIYQPESEKPLLETNLESLFKAVNRASLQVILLLEELPLVDVKELNLRKVSEGVRKASKMKKRYDELSPYLEPVRYLWQGSKLLLASNPLLAAGWIAGSEIFWKGGKKIGKRAIDAYLLSLVRQTLGIIAWETATIFDRTHRYRNPDWIYAVELAHLVSQVEINPKTFRAAMRELGKLPLRSSYDRIFLYRCVAQHVSPKPSRFAQPELMEAATRAQILEQLEQFLKTEIGDVPEKQIASWRKGAAERLSE
ncbi:MAG: hypothetical protein HKN23_08490 [Verrucomicrobiales bacterium]|nr:hypothetical protein [Verrucomicrobiales bacterium]